MRNFAPLFLKVDFMSITFSSCFYIIKSKYDPNKYIEWMNNFISIVNEFYLVIYTDSNSSIYINTNNNPKIKVILKPIEEFYNYKYKDYWIENHKKNVSLNDISCWELNMLWSEKIQFVKETTKEKYFDTEFYGWCDIGYFRNRSGDIHTSKLSNWGNNKDFFESNKDKICYGCISNNETYLKNLFNIVNNKNEYELPKEEIPYMQNSIAGGFFILNKDKIDWWSNTFDNKLQLYFKHNYLVKDDQIILLDCIFSNLVFFKLFRDNKMGYDNWFMFQRYLNS
jgi:hypothetical protein